MQKSASYISSILRYVLFFIGRLYQKLP